jgi:hypothetical protein
MNRMIRSKRLFELSGLPLLVLRRPDISSDLTLTQSVDQNRTDLCDKVVNMPHIFIILWAKGNVPLHYQRLVLDAKLSLPIHLC